MIKQLDIKDFTVFKDAKLEFSAGINVFLGANGTGKTHTLKLLYCAESYKSVDRRGMTPSDGESGNDHALNARQFGLVSEKFVAVFRPDKNQIGQLMGRHPSSRMMEIAARFDDSQFNFSIDPKSPFGSYFSDTRVEGYSSKATFLPTREILSIFPGFISAYLDRELEFDETYFDLCVALDRATLRGPRGEEAAALRRPLADAVRITVEREGMRFYLTSEADGKVEAQLAAEGLRRIATLMQLIANGSIVKDSIILWDEPETNLNPVLIKVVADSLLTLAAQGVQIFLATHDYLLINELSLQMEYRTEASRAALIRFFAFSRQPDNAVSVQSGSMLSQLDRNPIMDEFEALYDRERRLFVGENRRK